MQEGKDFNFTYDPTNWATIDDPIDRVRFLDVLFRSDRQQVRTNELTPNNLYCFSALRLKNGFLMKHLPTLDKRREMRGYSDMLIEGYPIWRLRNDVAIFDTIGLPEIPVEKYEDLMWSGLELMEQRWKDFGLQEYAPFRDYSIVIALHTDQPQEGFQYLHMHRLYVVAKEFNL